RVYQDIGRAVVIQNPLVECSDQVGATGIHLHGAGSSAALLHVAFSSRETANEAFAGEDAIHVSCSGRAWRGSSMPSTGRRQRIGARHQSTRRNSLIMKKGMSANAGATPVRLSRRSVRALVVAASELVGLVSTSTRALQSRWVRYINRRLLARATG